MNVVPKPHARWRVDAGPFVIHVHGTVFTAAWNETSGRLDVQLERGSISVEGPVTGRPHRHARGPAADGGDAAVARAAARDRRSEGDEALEQRHDRRRGAGRRGGAAPALAGPRPPPASRRPPHGPANAGGPSVARRALLVRRRWPRATSLSSSRRLARSAARAPDRRARTIWRRWPTPPATGAATIWRATALEAQRQRFHGSPRAADAAFFLGRLDENDGAGLIHALRWYDRYLDEAPTGSYAAEALGRKMVAMRDLYGVAQARGVADEYVRRFPHGSYAGAAQALRDQTRE